MKYLVVTERKIDTNLSPEESENLHKAQRSYIGKIAKEGKIELSYEFAEGGGRMWIFNLESGHEIESIVGNFPLKNLLATKVYPLQIEQREDRQDS